LVIATLNGILDEYHIFITNLATKEKVPLFDDLTKILLQEEHRKNLNNRFQNSDLALIAKAKKPYKGKPWERYIGSKSYVKLHQGRASPRTDTNLKKNNSFYYCDELKHYARDCREKKFHDSKYRRHANNFVDGETTRSDDLKNLKLFISFICNFISINK
jgi:hypothetical protein